MAKNSKVTVLVCSAIVLAATAALYMFVFGNIFSVTMRWVTLLFLIAAELIGACKLLFAQKTVFGMANITTSLIHIGLVFLVSMIFVNALPSKVAMYVWLNVFMLCALAAVDMVLVHSGGRIAAGNAKLAESQAVVASCHTKAQNLCVEYRGGSYIKELSEIAEMIKYSDNSVLTNDEMPILNGLEQLREMLAGDDPGVPEKITEIKNLIKMRSIKVASQKRGGY